MAEIQRVNGSNPGFTMLTPMGNEMVHAIACPNCGAPVTRILVVYEPKPTEPGWRAVDMPGRVSQLTTGDKQLVAMR